MMFIGLGVISGMGAILFNEDFVISNKRDNEEKKLVGYKGTEVPVEGYVEKIYFNTGLSVEEVIEILDSLEFIESKNFNSGTIFYNYIVFTRLSGEIEITINKSLDGIYKIFVKYNNLTAETYCIFCSTLEEGTDPGWRDKELYSVIDICYENEVIEIGSLLNIDMSFIDHEILSSLISTTPFEPIYE